MAKGEGCTGGGGGFQKNKSMLIEVLGRRGDRVAGTLLWSKFVFFFL